MFLFHFSFFSYRAKISLSCKTCHQNFTTPVKFGKHICFINTKTFSGKTTAQPPYKCRECSLKLSSYKRYSFHQQFHLPTCRPKVCLICEKLFDDDLILYEHVQFTHELIAEYSCKDCDGSFSIESELKRHINLRHTAERTYKCDECDNMFIDKKTLTEHKMIHLPNKLLQCEYCQQKFNRKTRLRKHIEIHLTKMEKIPKIGYVCQHCDRVFENKDDAIMHTNIYDVNSKIGISNRLLTFVLCCEYCEQAYWTRKSLILHRTNDHYNINDDKPFKCEHCPAKYDTYSKLKAHKNSHQFAIMHEYPFERKYICDNEKCLKSYKYWSDLTTHRKTTHFENPSIFKCLECNETFYNVWSFAYHKQSKHELPYKCNQCQQTFSTNFALKRHQTKFHSDDIKSTEFTENLNKINLTSNEYVKHIIKTDLNPFHCKTCDKSYSNSVAARSHIRFVHMKERNFKCDQCNKSFYSRQELKHHSVSVHSDEKNFSCDQCEYKSKTNKLLQRHLKSHVDVSLAIKYQCKHCLEFFRTNELLMDHIGQRHISIL